jgi:histidine kinase/DNA gyrase B/HSP90-like ATPase
MAEATLAARGEETVRMEVDKIGFLLERMGRDCDDLQFLRELTQNALEAGASRIHWDFDPHIFDATGVQKLCCIDNGCGMSPEEMRSYINRLSASGQRQALDANYGVGAKVATATRNPDGVIYQSWRDGKGAMIQLWRDPDTDEYGLRRFELDDGQWSFWIPLSDSAKPDIIDGHGTKVVLLGCDEDHNTMAPPEGVVATPSRWVSRFLNARYLDLPSRLELKAREGWDGDSEDKRNLMRRVKGQGRFLADHAMQAGTASLAACEVHWWILDEYEKRRSASDLVNTGHVATLWQNELYEMLTGRSGVSRLHQFGIIFGYDRVVLYIEPHNDSKQLITSNTARTQLLLQGQALPYADWAAEFREEMPQQLRDFMDAVIAGAKGANHQEAIAERLKHYRKLYRLSRYRLNQEGRLTVGESVLRRQKSGANSGDEGGRSKKERPRRPRDRTGRMLAAMLAAEGEAGDETPPGDQDLPKVTWVSLENKLRSTPEYLDDRAATYISEVNEIHANADFRAFTDMVDYWCDQYELEHGNKAVADVVHEWFEQALVETVLGCQALQGERRWPPDQIEKALSDESLTAAVLQRYHLANAIKRTLGAKLGSLKDREAA